MKKLLYVAILVCCMPLCVVAQSGPYSRVLFKASPAAMMLLAQKGVALDHLSKTENGYIGEFSKEETTIIKNLCMDVTVLIEDLTQYFLQNNSKAVSAKRAGLVYPPPVGFALGSMGGYLTMTEADSHINALIKKYPLLISKKDSIGRSFEGRTLYAFKVSDNPNMDEDEPELLYTALHHAREPISLMQMVYYVYYLLENYGKDSGITNIVDHSEMYFIPFVNPDGYCYNQKKNPKGGGYWRKNRRDNADTTFGVDLNRNYGFLWGLNNMGSSPDGRSDTYRGDSAFSEPETRAVRDFCFKRNFKVTLNYHSYGDDLIYPWGDDNGPSTVPDDSTYSRFANFLTVENNYFTGTCFQRLNYVVNGSSDDWMYGEQVSKDKIYAFTPEIGDWHDGFWPPIDHIYPHCDSSIRQNINLALIAIGMKKSVVTSVGAISNGGFHIYPNPSAGKISIQGPSDHTCQLAVFDYTGQLVFSGKVVKEVDLSFLSNGIYYCNLSIEGGATVKEKLIILK